MVNLWNTDVTPDGYGSKEQYYAHIFEQYRIFVEAAEQISNRRNQTNTFFLTLHSSFILLAQFLYEKGPSFERWFVFFPLTSILILCYVWWRLIKSYRQLNSAKFKVIREYEKKLPSSPYWKAEWQALGEGKNPNLYTPLTHLENTVPWIFAFIYVIGTIAFLLT